MIIFVTLLLVELTSGKVYDRCELARELKFVHKAPSHQLATWVCIAEHESQYNTSVVGHLCQDGSGDHGIFQISDLYWCSPPNKGYACGITCAELEDDDITDDFICAQRIYKEHKQLYGDGFNAWAVYKPLCKGSKADRYIKDCFNEYEPKSLSTPATAFAHGFFDTAVGKANRGFYPSTTKSNYPLSFTSPSIINQEKSTFASPKSSFLNSRFLTATENSNNFFTPTSLPTFRSTTTTTTTFAPPTTSNTNLRILNPTSILATNIVPAPRRTFFDLGNTFSTPSTTLFFTPTVSTTAYQASNNNQPVRKPIFIINGVQWY